MHIIINMGNSVQIKLISNGYPRMQMDLKSGIRNVFNVCGSPGVLHNKHKPSRSNITQWLLFAEEPRKATAGTVFIA